MVIPARYASTRLEGKPLIDLVGKTMIQRVTEQALKSKATRVIVATDDRRIEQQLISNGIEVVMTATHHVSGSDRIWEVIGKEDFNDEAVVVNVQGDEPLIPPEVINQVAELLKSSANFGVATLCEPITAVAEIMNPNHVKVVFDSDHNALYFSRAPIPWDRDQFSATDLPTRVKNAHYRHLGIYAYRRWALERFVNLDPSSLEVTESLEQLRLLQNGVRICVVESISKIPGGVDTPEDVDRVRAFLQEQSR